MCPLRIFGKHSDKDHDEASFAEAKLQRPGSTPPNRINRDDLCHLGILVWREFHGAGKRGQESSRDYVYTLYFDIESYQDRSGNSIRIRTRREPGWEKRNDEAGQ
jgi:hypothetical protein